VHPLSSANVDGAMNSRVLLSANTAVNYLIFIEVAVISALMLFAHPLQSTARMLSQKWGQKVSSTAVFLINVYSNNGDHSFLKSSIALKILDASSGAVVFLP
jgi:hypothetical protein